MKIATVIELFGLAHFLDVVYLVEVVELGVYVYVFRDDCNRFRGHHINDTAHDMNLFNRITNSRSIFCQIAFFE